MTDLDYKGAVWNAWKNLKNKNCHSMNESLWNTVIELVLEGDYDDFLETIEAIDWWGWQIGWERKLRRMTKQELIELGDHNYEMLLSKEMSKQDLIEEIVYADRGGSSHYSKAALEKEREDQERRKMTRIKTILPR